MTPVQGRLTWRDRSLLILTLLAALALRLYDVNWDEGHHTHPDERWIMMAAEQMAWPPDLATALDPHATTWNPLFDYAKSQETGEYRMRRFAYGHLPLYLLTTLAWFLHTLAPWAARVGAPADVVAWLAAANSYDGLPLVGRPLSALFDVGSVWLVFLIGRRLYGRRVGLLAAAWSALTVTQIQLAHFYAFDPVAAFFVLLSLYGAVRLVQGGGARAALLAGAAAGCAVSSKFSALPILAPLVIAAALAAWQEDVTRSVRSTLWARLWAIVRLALPGLLAALAAFVITSPFAVLDWPAYFEEVIVNQGAIIGGAVDAPYTRQYRGTVPFLYHIEQQVRWGMGWPLGVTAFLGLAWTLWRAARGETPPAEWVVLAWVIPYFGFTGFLLAKFMRYMLPLVPLFTLMGAAMLWAWWQRWEQAREAAVGVPWRLGIARLGWLAPIVMGIVLTATAFWALAFVNGVYGATHPWIEASRWFYANAPDGATIAWEHWDDWLPLPLKEPGMTPTARGYKLVALDPFDEDTAEKFANIKEKLRQADYISLASNRVYRAVPRLPRRYPMQTLYYRLLFEGKLGFRLAAAFTARPQLFGLVIVDDAADESFTLYDHPQPMIFVKERDLTDAEWEELLGGSWKGAIAHDTRAGW